jgi:hypothetical protein
MLIQGHELKINKYEFNEYLEVSYDGEPIIIPFLDIIIFFSNEMTNQLTDVKEEHYIYLYEYINTYL